jgi:hypothetical protein
MNQQTSSQPAANGGPSNIEKMRGNKAIRLVIIGLLIVVVAYLLYSAW